MLTNVLFVSILIALSLIFLFSWNVVGTVFLLRITLLMEDYRPCIHTSILILCWSWIGIFYILVIVLCVLGVVVCRGFLRPTVSNAVNRLEQYREDLRSHYSFFLLDLDMYSLPQLKVQREDLRLFLNEISVLELGFGILKEEIAMIKQKCSSHNELTTRVSDSNKTQSVELISFRSRKSSLLSTPVKQSGKLSLEGYGCLEREESENYRKQSCPLKESLLCPDNTVQVSEASGLDMQGNLIPPKDSFLKPVVSTKVKLDDAERRKVLENQITIIDNLDQDKNNDLADIEQSPTPQYLILNSQRKISLDDSLDDCYICLSSLLKKNRLIRLFCGHTFHLKCIFEWFNQKISCPTCKLNMRLELIKELLRELEEIIQHKECLFDEFG